MPALPAYQGAAGSGGGGEYRASGRSPPDAPAVSPEDIVVGGGSPTWSVVSTPGHLGQQQQQKHVSAQDARPQQPYRAHVCT